MRLAVTAILAVLAAPAAAQEAGRDSSRSAAITTEVWAGYSPGSTSAGFLGRHDGIKLGLAAVRFNWRIHASEGRSVYYGVDLIPLARLTPLIVYTTTAAKQCGGPKFDCIRADRVARGVGANPLGATMIFREDHSVQGRLGANAGILMFDLRAPSDLSNRFNFTAAIEGGVQWMSKGGNGALLAYRLHHLSNGGTASDNLAMLSHVFSIGGTWRTGKR